MPRIFGSFLVTLCAWQAVTFWLVNRTARLEHWGRTGVWPEGDHVMKTTRWDLKRVQRIAVERGTRACNCFANCLLFVSWPLRRPNWGSADGAEGIFGFCQTRVGFGPTFGPTLKKALCRTCLVVGRRIHKIKHGILYIYSTNSK